MTGSTAQSRTPWTARWCWSRKHLSRPWNYYVYFRRAFELSARPKDAVIRISADARYVLYVNGQRIHFGPARSYPEFQSFDAIDIADSLDEGANCVAVIGHQFGVPTFQSVFRDISGFILDGVVDTGTEQTPLHTPDGWLCREARGWRRDVARMSVQLGFQEQFDADADPSNWMAPSYQPKDEDGWFKPPAGPAVGTHPWLNMVPRGVPLLSQTKHDFASIVAQFRGENARGYKVAENISQLAAQEQRKVEKALVGDPRAMLKDDETVTTIAPPADGEFVGVTLDLEAYRTGHFLLHIEEAAGDEIIDIIYGEGEKNHFPLMPQAFGKLKGCEESTASRYRCRPGAQQWETFHFMGMRYVGLIFRNVEKPLKIRYVGVRQVTASLPEAGSFECSDERLNEIWRVGRETQRNCTFDTFVDCPWREQAQWWGDARVQARVTLFAFGDTSIFERGIRQMAQSQASDGSLHSHPPADIPGHRLPDFMLTWIGSLWDHYNYTGRTDLIRDCLPQLQRVLEFFHGHEVTDGLIGNFDSWWVFLDWQSLHKDNFSAVLNMMYLQGLRWSEKLFSIVEAQEQARQCGSRADSLQASIEKYFWDEKEKLWRDGFDPKSNARIDSISQHANALAILLDLKPETHKEIANDVLVKSARAKKSKILTASPFFYAYVLEALAKMGFRNEVIEIIREKWGDMIDQGAVTFWEMWNGDHSRCHAWSASPVYHLAQQILGVEPLTPGWKRLRIAPLPGKLEFARGIVPSSAGAIRVEWEKVEEDQLAVRVDLPEGITAEFVSPLGATRTIAAGKNEFHT